MYITHCQVNLCLLVSFYFLLLYNQLLAAPNGARKGANEVYLRSPTITDSREIHKELFPGFDQLILLE